MASLIQLPAEVILYLADHLHNIEDYTTLSSTCRTLRLRLAHVVPNTILHLAAAQSRIFFRPSPDFLVVATARQLGDWARISPENEAALALNCQSGMQGLLDLALCHCGITVSRIRELYNMRFSIINPVTNILDQCIGVQWGSMPDFWDGGVDDAFTISGDPSSTLFHLAIYGELFGPDVMAYIDGQGAATTPSHRALSIETRLEYIKYCIPDLACRYSSSRAAARAQSEGVALDPRLDVKAVGPYTQIEINNETRYEKLPHDNNTGLVWVLKSTRWMPHWREVRRRVADDFTLGPQEGWESFDQLNVGWRQNLWENVMICQGLEGLGMIRPEFQDSWLEKIREWRDKIEALEHEPKVLKVGRRTTYEYPFLMGELLILSRS